MSMKRKEIIDVINAAGEVLDTCAGADIIIKETNERIVDAVTEDEVHAVQCCLYVITQLLEGTDMNAIKLATKLISLIAVAKTHQGEGEGSADESEE